MLLLGIYMNLRGRVAAGWWVFTAAVALALVVFVHFLGGEEREASIRDIYAVYGSPVAGLAALVVLAGLLAGLSALLISAFGALRRRT
jgi:hypothetical protein